MSSYDERDAGVDDDLDDGLRAAVRRFDDAASVARERVRAHGRRVTQRSREAALRAVDIVRAGATADATRVAARIDEAVVLTTSFGATAGEGDDGAVPAGRVRVRRVTPATDAFDLPLLVPIGLGGGARIVGREGDTAAVLAFVGALVCRGVALGAFRAEDVALVNPRRRVLPAELRALPGLTELRDGRALLRAVGDARGGGPRRLVVLDHPHDLGLAGRRAVRSAACDPAFPFRLLAVHVAADDSPVDLEHRRLESPSWGVPHPPVACELWPARGGWRWPAHPELTVDLPRSPLGDGRESSGPAVGPGPVTSAAADRDEAFRTYGEGLDRLAAIARAHDDAVARARRTERAELDAAAARRRRTLDDIAAEERAVELQLRRVGGQPFERCPPRTAAPAIPAVRADDARDLTALRAARAAVVHAVTACARAPAD